VSKARFSYFDWTTQEKSLQDIKDLCEVDRRQKQAELRVEMRQTADEKNSLLERAGLTDAPEFRADDADKWLDEAYYRWRVRAMVPAAPHSSALYFQWRSTPHISGGDGVHGQDDSGRHHSR
jgi:hypothetical protein